MSIVNAYANGIAIVIATVIDMAIDTDWYWYSISNWSINKQRTNK